MRENDIESLELDLLLETLFRCWGYDFRSYARASIERRVRDFVSRMGLEHISSLIPLCIHDEELFSSLAQHFSIAVTEMFRDPFVYKVLREKVLPMLRTFPLIKIWHAGCATGEEVYSMAILIREHELSNRTMIFGTDFSDSALATAENGIYPVSRMKEFTNNYQEAGGVESFSRYYHASYDSASIDQSIRQRITFANHNLTVDNVFGEMHLVFCRNVLIYFNRDLQNRALRLFTDSLVRGGFLCLGTNEDLRFSEVADCYEVIDQKAKIYKKKVQ